MRKVIADPGIILVIAALVTVVLLAVTGCQSVTEREYYAPDSQCAMLGTDGLTRGAVKREVGKSGLPDFSDSKSFNLNFLNL